MSWQSRVPILFSGVALVLLGTLSWLKLRDWEGVALAAGVALVALYFSWLLLESRIAAGETAKQETPLDRGTLELYALGRLATVVLALALPTLWSAPGPWIPVGLGLFIGGVGFRLLAIHTLGRFYSHRVRLADDHAIVDTGPYRFVRHPAYTGMLVAHLGLVVFFFNWAALVALALVFVPAVVRRILVEERALLAVEAYAAYSRGRKRLLPLVW